jgi:hypothetical protein
MKPYYLTHWDGDKLHKTAAVCSWQRQYFSSVVHCCDLDKSLSRRSMAARSEHGRDTTLYVRTSLVGNNFKMITRHKTVGTRWPITRNRTPFSREQTSSSYDKINCLNSGRTMWKRSGIAVQLNLHCSCQKCKQKPKYMDFKLLFSSTLKKQTTKKVTPS